MRLVGVEAAGAAEPWLPGAPACCHGARSSLLADEDGQVLDAHSISAGLDYPGVGPEHAFLRDTGRAEYRAGDGRRSARRLPSARPARGNHPGARAGTRARASARLRRGLSSSSASPGGDSGPRDGSLAVKRLSVYLMAGPETPELAEAAVAGGADLLELGFPFSDPLADGPVIRRAGERVAQGCARRRASNASRRQEPGWRCRSSR